MELVQRPFVVGERDGAATELRESFEVERRLVEWAGTVTHAHITKGGANPFAREGVADNLVDALQASKVRSNL